MAPGALLQTNSNPLIFFDFEGRLQPRSVAKHLIKSIMFIEHKDKAFSLCLLACQDIFVVSIPTHQIYLV